jgi:hypothetical protein
MERDKFTEVSGERWIEIDGVREMWTEKVGWREVDGELEVEIERALERDRWIERVGERWMES